MLSIATARKVLLGCLFAAVSLPCCGPSVVPRAPISKKTDTLPNDFDSLVALAEANSFLDSKIPDLSDAAGALDKAILIAQKNGDVQTRAELSWKLARVCFYAAEQEKGSADKLLWIARGELAAEVTAKEMPQRVEGHYYLALLKGRRAQHSGIGFSAMALAKTVEELGLKTVEIDPTFEEGGPYRLLAMLYAHAPPWPTSIGDIDKAVEYADKAVGVSSYPMNHLVRGEVLVEADEIDAAKKELEIVLSSPRSGLWAHEGEIWRPYARQLLTRIEAEN
jgi:hypothetical protein